MAPEPSGYGCQTLIFQLLQDLIAFFPKENGYFYLHSLMILKTRTSNCSSSCSWMIVQKGWMLWLGTSCHGRTEQDSLGSCPVWWNLCGCHFVSKLCVLGTLQTAAYALAKPTRLAVLTNWHVLFLHRRFVPGGLSGACSFQPFWPMFLLRSWALHSLGSLETACPLGRWWFLFSSI